MGNEMVRRLIVMFSVPQQCRA